MLIYSCGIKNVTTAQSNYNCRYNFGKNSSYYIFITMFGSRFSATMFFPLFLYNMFSLIFHCNWICVFVNLDIKLDLFPVWRQPILTHFLTLAFHLFSILLSFWQHFLNLRPVKEKYSDNKVWFSMNLMYTHKIFHRWLYK